MRGVLVLIIIVLTFNSCNSITGSERRDIEDTVRRYNNALMEAYKSGDFSALRDVATEREYRKVMVYIQSYTSEGEKIVSELKVLKVKGIRKKSPNKAEVLTKERWTYSRIDHRTGKTLVPETIYEYEIQYNVTRENNSWKIASIKVLKEAFSTLRNSSQIY